MKTITNRKRTLGGFLSYHFTRVTPSGKQFRYVLHLSPAEQSNGRAYVANRVRKARRYIKESVDAASRG